MKLWLRDIMTVGAVSFLLQLIWEVSQCSVFYQMELNLLNPLLWSATFGDMNMTIFLYALLSFVHGTRDWIEQPFTKTTMVIMTLYALFLSFFFEISALYKGRWEYSGLMPFFPGTNIGLLPVVQLLILFPAAFYISKLVLKRTENARV
ncbi:hypothetical protein [Bacillus marinisedimentorum]|uniref:hypothetical protein n=1 Tax=Bacillus marinisedimentorum TaxID=1821260 RepID=UPI0007E23928|nr:hypothetical protein [Bacillus marinisedimentorum]